LKKDTSRIREILRFVITGGVCFLIEFVLLVLLRDRAHWPTLIANAVAFLVSVVVNYLLCVFWVFRTRHGGVSAGTGFLVTSLIGLALNELLMFLFGLIWGEDGVLLTLAGRTVSMYMFSKCLATGLVMVWNYISKRYVLRHGRVG